MAREIPAQFEGGYRLAVHMAPPLLAQRDAQTGQLRKRAFGPWIFSAMRILAKFKGLRGTPFDPFGRTEERRAERKMAEDYIGLAERIAGALQYSDYDTALALAALPEKIRGFGHVKEESMRAAEPIKAGLLAKLDKPAGQSRQH